MSTKAEQNNSDITTTTTPSIAQALHMKTSLMKKRGRSKKYVTVEINGKLYLVSEIVSKQF